MQGGGDVVENGTNEGRTGSDQVTMLVDRFVCHISGYILFVYSFMVLFSTFHLV